MIATQTLGCQLRQLIEEGQSPRVYTGHPPKDSSVTHSADKLVWGQGLRLENK